MFLKAEDLILHVVDTIPTPEGSSWFARPWRVVQRHLTTTVKSGGDDRSRIGHHALEGNT